MDQIDVNLIDAWHRISAQCRGDRLLAAQRAARRHSQMLLRPPRAWCLCLRASDTRISTYNAVIELDPDFMLASPGENIDKALERGAPHTLTLTGKLIRQLTQPVEIPWPGIDWTIAARRLGMHCEMLRSWIQRGALKVFERAYARSLGKRGKPVPIVWAPSPLDPNAVLGRAPDPIWGTLWQSLWDRLPEDYELIVQRVPNVRPYAKHKWDDGECYDIRQRGWRFVCPGRFNLDHSHRPCGRLVKRLFAPQSIWTIAHALGDESGFDISQDAVSDDPRANELSTQDAVSDDQREEDTGPHHNSTPSLRLTGPWHPISTDPSRATGLRTFACQHCWRIRYLSLITSQGWNEFITYLTGGLLRGREVKRPLAEAPFRRQRAYRPHQKRRPAQRRQQTLELLMQGLRYDQIAQRMKITFGTVAAHAKALHKQYQVHSRAELARKLGRPVPRSNHGKPALTEPRRKKVRALRARGWSYQQIAHHLGVSYNVVHTDIKLLRSRKREVRRSQSIMPAQRAQSG